MRWRDLAACQGADPHLFEPVDRVEDHHLADATATAQAWCAACPALHGCAGEADRLRMVGLWAGSLRSGVTNRYRVWPLIEGAPRPVLADRRVAS